MPRSFGELVVRLGLVALSVVTGLLLAPFVPIPAEVIIMFALVAWPAVIVAGLAIRTNYQKMREQRSANLKAAGCEPKVEA